ncbi:PQQ-dependent sugar dehydrogenase [Microbacterium sp. gxy059]|uniref:PQQ-dependent sugar dehydrogenase n=1 Tax=Microbacterium sp. gxy059 TaxID=2957199 RepID=UPI003D996509
MTAVSATAALSLTMSGALLSAPAAADVAESGFTEVVDFETYSSGALDGQDGWTASTAAAVVPDPLNGNNRVAHQTGGGESAFREIPAIADGDTGTLFFRILRTGGVDTSFGITDVDAPADYSDSRAYVNIQNSDELLVRDGDAFAPAGTWVADAWQCVWVVADNDADQVSVYSQGGPYDELTRLPEGAEEQFGFRASVDGALDRFFWINGADSAGDQYLDDVAIDTTGENLEIASGNPADCEGGGSGGEDPLLNPLPDPTVSDLGIELEELSQLPESETTPETQDERLIRHNRINALDELPDGSGRLMVPDMNDILYMVDKETGEHVPYLDVREEFVDNFHNNAGLGTGLGFAEFHPEFAENGIFYTVHTEAGSALVEDEPDFPGFGSTGFHSVLTEWTADDPAAETFSGTSREVMRVPYNGRVHTMQQIAFNPTAEKGDADYGMLYILSGDGGNGVDNGNPQDLATPQGTIMRIDPLGDDSENGQYGIPADNPFVGAPDALGEIYAVGMRDPHRISWDDDGTLYLGHIGEWQVESVYEVQAGDNFGWSDREGPFVAKNRQIYPLPEDDAENGYTYPVAAYDHNRDPGQTGDAGVALNGGFVYHGAIPELQDRYLFTDLVHGWVLSTDRADMQRSDGSLDDLAPIERLRVFEGGEETTFADLVGDKRVDLRFGQDADGELYLIAKANGKIWKVTGAHEIEQEPSIVLPEIAESLVAHYDFDHPVDGDATREADRGSSGTDIGLINGGVEMRVEDAAYPGAGQALQTQQMSPQRPEGAADPVTPVAENDDWKAGVYDADGVGSLSDLAGASGISVMGWFKPTGSHPAHNTNTEDPDDVYNAVGLAGVLAGSSNGHDVRALLEVIEVSGELKLVALGRQIDGEGSWTYAADLPWDDILVRGDWVHLAATFDFAGEDMRLFMNGEPLEGEFTSGSPWDGGPTSETDPAGIKIGGSFPQNTQEANPFTGRMDDLMILDAALTPEQVAGQYAMFEAADPEEPTVPQCALDETLDDLMAADMWEPKTPEKWELPGDEIILAEPGDDPDDGIRRPFEYALLNAEEPFGSVQIDAEVRLDEPTAVNNRDVIMVFGYQSDTEYYYAHLSQDNTIYAHNGIFKVDGADRERIDDQWDERIGAPPAVTDEEFHQVRVVHCADTGEMAVWVDGLDRPLMTATDTTFGSGRIGFGSFDNVGRMRNLAVSFASEGGDPEPGEASIAFDRESVAPGEEITGTVSGLEPGETVDAEMRSDPVYLGSHTADDDGVAAIAWTVPEDAEPGSHTLVVTRADGAEVTGGFEVTAAGGGDEAGDDESGGGDEAGGDEAGDGTETGGDDGSGGGEAGADETGGGDEAGGGAETGGDETGGDDGSGGGAEPGGGESGDGTEGGGDLAPTGGSIGDGIIAFAALCLAGLGALLLRRRHTARS